MVNNNIQGPSWQVVKIPTWAVGKTWAILGHKIGHNLRVTDLYNYTGRMFTVLDAWAMAKIYRGEITVKKLMRHLYRNHWERLAPWLMKHLDLLHPPICFIPLEGCMFTAVAFPLRIVLTWITANIAIFRRHAILTELRQLTELSRAWRHW